MRFLLRILDFFLYSNIFISVCAAGLVWETYLLSGIPASLRLMGMVFFATLFLYNADSLLPYKYEQDVPLTPKLNWVRNNRLVLMSVSVASALCAITLYFSATFDLSFWFLLHLAVVAGLYSVPILPEREGYIPLRDVPLLKVFLIAYVWAAVTVQLPQMEAGKDLFAPDNLVLFIRRALFIFSLTLVFDIRDLNKDKMTGTLTFPGKWGVVQSKRFALGALLLYTLLLPSHVAWGPRIGLGLSGLGAALVVWNANENRSPYYFLILADGMMLVQAILVWLFL